MIRLNVKNEVKNVKETFKKYAAGLILTAQKKSCFKIAEALHQTHDQIYKMLNISEEFLVTFPQFLFETIQKISAIKKGWLIIDDTLLSKIYSKFIEGVDIDFNSSKGRNERGFSTVVIAWTNGEITIPLDFEFWLSEGILKEQYLKKSQLAQLLIKRYCKKLEIEGILLDGLYCTPDMIRFLNDANIFFEMRIASNRVIEIDNATSGQLKNLSQLKLTRNSLSKTISGIWHSCKLYFTAEKRKNKNNEYSVVFIVSNKSASSKQHVINYSLRWNIEKFFRTAKQYLGIAHCFARRIIKQKYHIFNVFYAYAFLQLNTHQMGFSSAEDSLKYFQSVKIDTLFNAIDAFHQISYALA